MKKSVKSFLLALMVLCLSATAGFAATTKIPSADVTLTVSLLESYDTDDVEISSDTTTLRLTSVDGGTGSTDATVEVINHSSDIDSITLVLDIDTTKTLVSADGSSTHKTPSIDVWGDSVDNPVTDTTGSVVSFSIAVSIDTATTIEYPFTMDLSADNKSADFIFTLKVIVSTDFAATGDAFTDATITATGTTTTSIATIEVSADTNSFDLTGYDYETVSGDALTADSTTYEGTAGETVTFALSGTNSTDIKGIYVLDADGTSKDITTAKSYALPSTTGNNTFYFVFSSADTTYGGVKFVISTASTANEAFEDATITVTNGSTTVATVSVTSDDDTFALEAYDYATVTADDAIYADTGSYSASTGATLTFAISGTSKANIKAAYVLDADGESDDIDVTGSSITATLSSTKGDNTFYFVFSSADTTYGGVSFVITGTSSSGIDEEDAESLVSTDVAKSIASKTVTSVSASSLKSANATVYNALLSALGLSESQIANRVVFFKIDGTIASGTTIGVNLVPVDNSNGDNPDYTDMSSGYYTTSTAFSSGYFAVDTQSLTDVNSSSSATLTYDPDYYLVLVTIFGGFSSSSISTAADSDEYLNGGTNYLSAEIVTGGSNKGSSSGCDAGFGALALLAIVPFIKKIRK